MYSMYKDCFLNKQPKFVRNQNTWLNERLSQIPDETKDELIPFLQDANKAHIFISQKAIELLEILLL
jgi:NADH:ubiquinone oxidoreductase subunit E